MHNAHCVLLENFNFMYVTLEPFNFLLKTRIKESNQNLRQLAAADIFNPIKIKIRLGDWNNGAFDVEELQIQPLNRQIRCQNRSFAPLVE